MYFAVRRADSDQEVVGRGLGVLDEDVEVPVVIEQAGVDELVFQRLTPARAVGAQQVRVGIRALWILVEHPHVRVGGRAVEVVVALLNVLTVIAFGTGQTGQVVPGETDTP